MHRTTRAALAVLVVSLGSPAATFAASARLYSNPSIAPEAFAAADLESALRARN